ncbi:hypothetical protein [Chryseobacterium sp.]|uniref:hypothetical protein n=1 Tax=Chryseobacterium sp. TaxID=1871047 RepID=UPI0035B2050B
MLTISSKLYYNIGAKDNSWIGVTPDFKAKNKKSALNIVTGLIKISDILDHKPASDST